MSGKYSFSVLFLSIALAAPVLGSTGDDQLTFIHGAVAFQYDANSVSAPAKTGVAISKFTKISTGGDGLAEIRFRNGSQVRLTGNTSIQFEELHYSPNLIPLHRITRFELLKGTIYLDYRASNDDIIVHAKSIQLLTGERQTSYRISRQGGETLVAVFEGSLYVNSIYLTDTWTRDWIWDDEWSGIGNLLAVNTDESVRSDADAGVLTFVAHGIDGLRTDSWNDMRRMAPQAAAFAFVSPGSSPLFQTRP
jgi:hypothetical protein